MQTALFDYDLPGELIAQQPLPERDQARMLVAGPHGTSHHQVRELPGLLAPGDLIILNHSRVFPARLHGHKVSGGALEVLLVHREETTTVDAGERWQALIRGKVAVGTVVRFRQDSCTVEALHADGTRSVRFPAGVAVLTLAEAIGTVPLPPYIDRAADSEDLRRYQTVYADAPGSVAAPTAGLHLTPRLLQELRDRGVESARVELAIGPGTFKPVDCEQLEDFVIHAEHCHCPQATVDAIRSCQERAGRVIAIGTTALRTIETAARQPGGLAPYQGWTRLFLHPPQQLQVITGLLTNFHLPRSSLLMAVSCLSGRERLQALYREALEARYRFLSYGDCMLWLPDPLAR
jgi:S-adenosylmethionine:tRNA ribosyltransferase-isomerase